MDIEPKSYPFPKHPGYSCVKSFLADRIPAQLVIQFTNHCNARCPQCGMRVRSGVSRSTLSGETVRRILEAAAAKGVTSLSFTGGEPLLFLDDLVDWLTFAGRLGIPYLRTGTNGFLLRHSDRPGFEDRIKRLAHRLAGTPLRNFWISLDSAFGPIHEQMRGLRGVVAGMEKALPIFHAAGIYPSANLGINRLVAGAANALRRPRQQIDDPSYLDAFYRCYRDAFHRFYGFVRQLGFTMVNTCYPMSIGEAEQAGGLTAVYAASAVEDVVRFTPGEKAMLYKALLNTIPEYRRLLRIFTPLSSLHMLCRQHAAPETACEAFGCRGGVDFFFIDAVNGDTYPCGFRGNENLGKFWQLDLAARKPNGGCHKCDWECFRDPSEMCAPLLQGIRRPLQLTRRFLRDPAYRKLWLEDLRYYKACHLFDGRLPMDAQRLRPF